jgi:hypothetical protein
MRLRQFFASVLVVLLSQATIAAGQSAPQSIIRPRKATYHG